MDTGYATLANTQGSPAASQNIMRPIGERSAESSTTVANDHIVKSADSGDTAQPSESEILRAARSLLRSMSEMAASIPDVRPPAISATSPQSNGDTGPNDLPILADAAATGECAPATGGTEQASPQDSAAGVIPPELFEIVSGHGQGIRKLCGAIDGIVARFDANDATTAGLSEQLEELRERFNALELQYDNMSGENEASDDNGRAGPYTHKVSPPVEPTGMTPPSKR
nr:hypothetical protein B0A51_09257 [Rachicladosporium sp. CCFEE 5018]